MPVPVDGLLWRSLRGCIAAAAVIAPLILLACRPAVTARFQDGSFATVASTEGIPGVVGTNAVPPGCPLPQPGVIDAASVPVGGSNDLRVVLTTPAPPGGTDITLRMANQGVATAGSTPAGLFAELHIPEGQQVSPKFDIFGKAVGQTHLTGTATGNIIVLNLPVGVWDVGDGGNLRLIDMNARHNSCQDATNPGTLSTDPAVLATCGRRVRGAAADGVTPLLVKVNSGLAGDGCFALPPGPPDAGQLSDSVASTVNVGGQEKAFSVYTSPDEMETTSVVRSVGLDVTFVPNGQNVSPSTMTVPVSIVPPPLVAVHGLWGDAAGWNMLYSQRNNRFETAFLADYSATNNRSFALNVDRIPIFVKKALILSRQKDFAATQADIVAHSMGGILTRLHLLDPASNVRPDNLGQGDVHKFIMVDSPQHGSNLANLLVHVHAVAQSNAVGLAELLGGRPDAINGGAVCDLAENSPALQALTATTIPVHSVTATGGGAGSGPPMSAPPDMPASFPFVIERLINYWAPTLQAQITPYRFRQANDFVVGLSSQQAGLGAAAIHNFPGLLHAAVSPVPLVEDGVTEAFTVASHVLHTLSQTTSAGPYAAGLPAVPSDGSAASLTVPGLASDGFNWNAQCQAGGSLRELPPGTANAAAPNASPLIQIISPAPGTVFAPGDVVSVQVQVDPGVVVDRGSAALGYAASTFETLSAAPFDYAIQIPGEFAGEVPVTANVFDSAGSLLEAAPVTILVQPSTPPASLEVVSSAALEFPAVGSPERLSVIAADASGVRRDVSDAAAGTTYASSDAGVVSVDADGFLTPLALGEAMITATHLGVQGFSLVRVGDPSGSPLATNDVTSQVVITRGGIRLDRTSGLWVQEVRVANPGTAPIAGPLSLGLSGLPAGVTWADPDGFTIDAVPLGAPYARVPLANGVFLLPGEETSNFVHFLNPDRLPIDFSSRVLQGTDP